MTIARHGDKRLGRLLSGVAFAAFLSLGLVFLPSTVELACASIAFSTIPLAEEWKRSREASGTDSAVQTRIRNVAVGVFVAALGWAALRDQVWLGILVWALGPLPLWILWVSSMRPQSFHAAVAFLAAFTVATVGIVIVLLSNTALSRVLVIGVGVLIEGSLVWEAVRIARVDRKQGSSSNRQT